MKPGRFTGELQKGEKIKVIKISIDGFSCRIGSFLHDTGNFKYYNTLSYALDRI